MAMVIPHDVAPAEDGVYFRSKSDQSRRLNFEFFDQLDCLDLSNVPHDISEMLEGAD